MFELLSKSIKERVSISEEEFDFAKTLFIPKKLRKRRYLLQEGDVCKYTAFVEKGMLRTHTIDDKGNEPILQFSFEGWWVADLYSVLTDDASNYNIEALEDCELLMITKPSWDWDPCHCPARKAMRPCEEAMWSPSPPQPKMPLSSISSMMRGFGRAVLETCMGPYSVSPPRFFQAF